MRKPNLVRKKRIWFHGLKLPLWVHSLGLRGFAGWLISRRKIMGIRATKIGVAVEKAKLDQRAKEDVLLKFFKEH